jgi:hypothetical protein
MVAGGGGLNDQQHRGSVELHGCRDQWLDRLQTAEAIDGERVILLEAVRERQRREQSRHLTTR